ncbi:MAG: polyphosphate kinase 1, partial [Ignavibacteriales bacterium]|nr:polyphosphate kinase 1 [Ignavibacteriales bacterium]
YSFKITRDAELYIEDEFQGNLLQKITKSLNKREVGAPCRFTYDSSMPKPFLKFLLNFLGLSKHDLFPGGKYHNFADFFSFPNPTKRALVLDKLIPNKIKELEGNINLFDAISRRDFLFNFPYHSYEHVLNLLKQAAEDPLVTTIKITQYRVAKKSEVIKYLLRAANNGKDVVVFVELKARFDEEQNIKFAQQMEKAGINVLYSFPGLKVHSKILQITRKEGKGYKYYSYLGTGNFNESTARIYCDIGLFTADKRLTEEVERVFLVLAGKKINYKFKHLLVAQFNMRKDFIKMIDNEIANAKKGKEARMIIKMNSLEDKKMIDKLYEASQAGVKIDMIIRGICCLVPGVKGLSDNINGISIVDLYLEHARLFVFHNGGKEKYYASSADWMRRNLSRRIEVAFPIYDKTLQKIIKDILNIQLSDNVKSRIIDKSLSNKYKTIKAEKSIQSQIATYTYFKLKEG